MDAFIEICTTVAFSCALLLWLGRKLRYLFTG